MWQGMVRQGLLRWGTALGVLLAAGSGAWAQTAPSAANLAIAALCDKLASDPADPGKPDGVTGVASSAMDTTTAAATCQTAAELMPDEPRLAYNLGRALLAGGNAVEAYSHLRAASDSGYGAASWLIGEMHAKGQGFPVDAAKAEVFHAKAGTQGFVPPVDPVVKAAEDYRLGIELQELDSFGFRNAEAPMLQMAETYLEAAAEANHPGARQALVDLRLSGVPFDAEAAFADLMAFAETGDPWAQFTLAENLITSEVGPYASLDATAQFTAATELLEKAAAQDYPDALTRLADYVGSGLGSNERDPARSAELYRRAAELGHARAAGEYGFILYRASKTQAEAFEAGTWFQKALDGGNFDGALGLGHLFYTGDGLPKDIAQAYSLYTQSAEKGFSGVAYYMLARIHDREKGFVDHAKAAQMLIEGIDEVDGPEDEAAKGFKDLSRETRVALQEALIKRGLLKGKADGAFGPASLKAYLAVASWRS